MGDGILELAAIITGKWFLSALPVGLVFGFFLQKGDLRGASAFSEVLPMRDGRKLFGLWVAAALANWTTTYFHMMGGSLAETRQLRDAIRARVEAFIKDVAGGRLGTLDFSLRAGKGEEPGVNSPS